MVLGPFLTLVVSLALRNTPSAVGLAVTPIVEVGSGKLVTVAVGATEAVTTGKVGAACGVAQALRLNPTTRIKKQANFIGLSSPGLLLFIT